MKLAEEKAIGDKRIAENIAYEKAKADKIKEKSKALTEALEKAKAEKMTAEKLKAEEKTIVERIPENKSEMNAVANTKAEELIEKPKKSDVIATVVVEQKADKTVVS